MGRRFSAPWSWLRRDEPVQHEFIVQRLNSSVTGHEHWLRIERPTFTPPSVASDTVHSHNMLLVDHTDSCPTTGHMSCSKDTDSSVIRVPTTVNYTNASPAIGYISSPKDVPPFAISTTSVHTPASPALAAWLGVTTVASITAVATARPQPPILHLGSACFVAGLILSLVGQLFWVYLLRTKACSGLILDYIPSVTLKAVAAGATQFLLAGMILQSTMNHNTSPSVHLMHVSVALVPPSLASLICIWVAVRNEVAIHQSGRHSRRHTSGAC